MTKMTYAMALDFAIANIDNAEVVEKLEQLKTSVTKKSTGEKKPTARQNENGSLKNDIVAFMETGRQYTISELMKGVASLAELSNQRVSAIVKQMKDDGILVREEIKRKAYFSLAE